MNQNRERAKDLTGTVTMLGSLACLVMFGGGVWLIIDKRWEYGVALVIVAVLYFLTLKWAMSVVKMVADVHAAAFPDGEPQRTVAATSTRPARTLGKPIYDE